jgi:hypothetical protein
MPAQFGRDGPLCISGGIRTSTRLSCSGSVAFSGQSPEAIFDPVKVNAVKRVV